LISGSIRGQNWNESLVENKVAELQIHNHKQNWERNLKGVGEISLISENALTSREERSLLGDAESKNC